MKKLLVLLSFIPTIFAVENSQFSLKAEVDALVAAINAAEKESEKYCASVKSFVIGFVEEARKSEMPALTLVGMSMTFEEGIMQIIALKIAEVAAINAHWARCEKINLTGIACELSQAIELAGENADNDAVVQAKRLYFDESLKAANLSDEDCKEILKVATIEFCDLLLEKLN